MNMDYDDKLEQILSFFNDLDRQAIEHAEKMYVDTENPVWAWDAWLISRETRQPAPATVLKYIDKVAEDIISAARECTNNQPTILNDIMRFKVGRGETSPFMEYGNYIRDRKIATNYYIMKDQIFGAKRRYKHEIIKHLANVYCIGEDSIKRAIDRFKIEWEKPQ